ncbi:MAG TPA: protein kinase [Terriglobia bacterium]|nr:protein kinase [Terriglobia bacterium]
MPDHPDDPSRASKRPGAPEDEGGSADSPSPPVESTKPLSQSPLSPGGTITPPSAAKTNSLAPSLSAGVHAGIPTFAPEELVAARYQVVRFIGQGGMGEVYEAQDVELRQRVALKTVRPEIARDQQAIERFKREIRIAREVTHPNVSRVFDLGYHRSPAGPEIMFLTMELLSGESLAARLKRVGRMTEKEALPLVRQLAAGLSAVHKLGIVHRDFKSANVVLVPSSEEEGGLRAVVADFGLARRTTAGEAGVSMLSSSGEILGTPAYMAPEQVRGAETTAAADIYALGVVMYEMVCGIQPFIADTPFATAVKRLEEAPPSPLSHVPGLDPKWEATILRCLERDPTERFAHPNDIVKALQGEPTTVGRRALEKRKTQRLRVAGAALAGIFLVVALLGYRLYVGRHAEEKGASGAPGLSAHPRQHRATVAVLGFRNSSGQPEKDYLSTALAEMLTAELQVGGELRAIPQDRVSRMKQDISLTDVATLPRATLVRVQDNLGADSLVFGSYTVQGSGAGAKVHVELQLENASGRNTPFSIADDGDEANLFPLVSHMGKQLREKLATTPITQDQEAGVKASLPASPGATRLYSEALDKLRALDLTSARDGLERAVNLDPTFALAHSALAETLQNLGYDEKAQTEARTASDLSYQLIPEQRNLVEARYRAIFSEWDQAIEIYHSLWTVTDNIEYGLLLAQTQTSAGRGTDALATIDSLRKLPPPSGQDPRIDYAEALADDSLSDFKHDVAATEKAVQKADQEGARYLAAQALLEQCWAYGNLSEAAQATTACKKALDAFTAVSDLMGKARSLTRISLIAEAQGDINQALDLRNQALALARQVGSKKDIADALLNIGNLQSSLDNLDGAQKSYQESLAVATEINNSKEILDAENNLGTLFQSRCDFEKAKETYEKSRVTAEASGDKAAVAKAVYNIGGVLFQLGDLPSALADIQKAIAAGREVGDKSDVADWLFTQGDVLMAKDDLAGAEKSYVEAREFLAPDEKHGLAVSSLEMAFLNLERGQAAAAEKLARPAADEFQAEKDVGDEAASRDMLGRACLAQGKLDEAQKEIDRANKLAPKDCGNRLPLAITTTRLLAYTHQPAAAQRAIESVLGESKAGKLDGIELDARLAQGEIEFLAGDAPLARARLKALQTLATQRHFLLAARKARALAQSGKTLTARARK